MLIAIKQHKAVVPKVTPLKIHTILTDNGQEFTGRLFGSRSRHPAGARAFDPLCQALGIDHQVT
ncbi:MAG: hypothetical protein RSB86_04300 [Comamonas sp.]|uniref:hypothetical protein n=1 Tax=Comamonas sp. TaxID=34028 RepID=UPI002FC70FE3